MRRQTLIDRIRKGATAVEFETAAGEALAISIPGAEAAVIRYFQERMPYGCSCREVRHFRC